MAKLFNLARMTTPTTGAGTITLGSAVSGFLSFAAAGVANGDVISYGITDGANSEVGTGTYTAAGTTLTRTVLASTNAGSPIVLSGTAQVFITALKEDFDAMFPKSGGVLTGDVDITKATPVFNLKATSAGQNRVIASYLNTTPRWSFLFGDSAAESGSDAGSNIQLIPFNDAGSPQTAALAILRATGLMTIRGDPTADLGVATKRYVDRRTDAPVYAEAYGAVGNASTDDTSALQSAIDATPAGGTLVLPRSGLCKVLGSGSQCLLVTKGICIAGNGPNSGLVADSTVPNTRDIIGVVPTASAAGFLFRDFAINNSAGVRHGININGGTVTTIYNAYFERLLIAPTAGGNSIFGSGSTDGVLAYSSIRDCNLESIKIDTCGDGLAIAGNIISATGSNQGIRVTQVAGAAGLNIRANVIIAAAGMIWLDRAYNPIIEANELEQAVNNTETNGALIDLNGATGTGIAGAKVSNNSIGVNSGVTGVTAPVRVATAQGTRIDGNKLSTRGSSHIVVTAAASDTWIGPANEYSTNDVLVTLALTDSGTRTGVLKYFGGVLESDAKFAAKGTSTNDSAAAGDIGEYLESSIGSGSAVSLTTGTAANMTSLSLTAGDWNVWCTWVFQGGGTTTLTALQASLSFATAAHNFTQGQYAAQPHYAQSGGLSFLPTVLAQHRMSLNSTTTVFAVATAIFGVSTCSVYGRLCARRVR